MNSVLLSNGITMPGAVLGSFNVSDQMVIDGMVNAALSEGITGFDTSPSYESEKILGKALQHSGISRERVFLSDKVDGWQMFEGNGCIERYVEKSMKDLGTEYLDLLLIHWPFPRYLEKTWKSFEKLYEQGIVRSIGLCNVNARTYGEFLQNDVRILPHVVQIEISPLRTADNDLTMFAEAGIVVEAYSPLGRMVPEIRNNAVLQELADKYGKSIAQIVLRWHLERNVIPVFTSTKPSRIKENAEAFHFSLEQSDVNRITALNQNYKIFPESYGCPGY